jgi:transposase
MLGNLVSRATEVNYSNRLCTQNPDWWTKDADIWPPPHQGALHRASKPRPLLTGWQAAKVEALKKACPDFARMRSLVLSFRGILQSGKAATLARWMKKAVASGIYGMKRFVRKLNHDLAAVKNALRESWSNGPVESHINRLKTLKRQMYGRAGFELLRARLLPVSRRSTLHRK